MIFFKKKERGVFSKQNMARMLHSVKGWNNFRCQSHNISILLLLLLSAINVKISASNLYLTGVVPPALWMQYFSSSPLARKLRSQLFSFSSIMPQNQLLPFNYSFLFFLFIFLLSKTLEVNIAKRKWIYFTVQFKINKKWGSIVQLLSTPPTTQ